MRLTSLVLTLTLLGVLIVPTHGFFELFESFVKPLESVWSALTTGIQTPAPTQQSRVCTQPPTDLDARLLSRERLHLQLPEFGKFASSLGFAQRLGEWKRVRDDVECALSAQLIHNPPEQFGRSVVLMTVLCRNGTQFHRQVWPNQYEVFTDFRVLAADTESPAVVVPCQWRRLDNNNKVLTLSSPLMDIELTRRNGFVARNDSLMLEADVNVWYKPAPVSLASTYNGVIRVDIADFAGFLHNTSTRFVLSPPTKVGPDTVWQLRVAKSRGKTCTISVGVELLSTSIAQNVWPIFRILPWDDSVLPHVHEAINTIMVSSPDAIAPNRVSVPTLTTCDELLKDTRFIRNGTVRFEVMVRTQNYE